MKTKFSREIYDAFCDDLVKCTVSPKHLTGDPDLIAKAFAGQVAIPDFFTYTTSEYDDVWTIPESFVTDHEIPKAPEPCDHYYTAYGDLCAGTVNPHSELYSFDFETMTWNSLR